MNYNVLVVDDEESILSSINRLLVRKHFSVFVVQSGNDALKLLEHEDFAVIVTDHRMPGMSGIELLQAVKMLSPNTVRIMMTGFADSETLMDAINKGNVMQVVSKPWSDSALVDSVSNAVNLYNLKDENEKLNGQLVEKNKELASVNDVLEQRVSERNIAMYELDKSNKILEESNQIQKKVLATLSHELRGPASSMASLVSFTLKGEVPVEKSLHLLHDACLHQQHLAEDILEYSTLEEYGNKLSCEPFSIEQSIDFVIQMANIEALKSDINIELTNNLTDDEAVLDKTKFSQILLNIIYNSVKYSPDGGTIYLKLWDSETVTGAKLFYISVLDEGPGITPSEISSLFQPFEQLDNKLLSRDKGFGLGLSIAKRLVELQGGEIVVDAERTSGCCFTISFPFIAEV